MSDKYIHVEQLKNPFNDVTRKIRRNLLISSVIGIIIVKVGLIPTKISAFGIEFTQTNRNALLIIIALTITYFLISFLVYVLSEIAAWNLEYREQELERFKSNEIFKVDEEEKAKVIEFLDRYEKTKKSVKIMFIIRWVVEIFIPIIIAIYTIFSIYTSNF